MNANEFARCIITLGKENNVNPKEFDEAIRSIYSIMEEKDIKDIVNKKKRKFWFWR